MKDNTGSSKSKEPQKVKNEVRIPGRPSPQKGKVNEAIRPSRPPGKK